jgi:uncharacterized protein
VRNIPEDIAPIMDELKVRLKEFYGEQLVKLVLFGSRARGDNDPDSDIDLLAVFRVTAAELDHLPYPTDIIMDILDRSEMLVSVIEIDEDRFLNRQGPLLRNVRREGGAVD